MGERWGVYTDVMCTQIIIIIIKKCCKIIDPMFRMAIITKMVLQELSLKKVIVEVFIKEALINSELCFFFFFFKLWERAVIFECRVIFKCSYMVRETKKSHKVL